MKIFISVIIILMCASCREGIIERDNFAGKINEPVQVNKVNSYTFLINAETFSMNLSVPATFSSSTARVSITLIDHRSGYANVAVRDFDDRERFRHSVSDDVELYTDLLDGFVLKTIVIRTENFSGKLKIQFSRAF